MLKINTIAVFCGANSGNKPIYGDSAIQLANLLVERGITLVYGGANVGLMGILADQVLSLGGHVIGVIPKSLVNVEIAHQNLTTLHVVNSMHERKALIAELSDGFIMLPGGPGSLDEFFEMYTWAQLGYHSKPCGILNINGYHKYLLQFLDHLVAEGFLKQVHRDMILVEHSCQALMQKFATYQTFKEPKWNQ